jgi:hypothetical protein
MTAHPIGPRLTTSTALEHSRTAVSERMMSSLPPAMLNSSIVPMTRSKRGSICCRWRVTVSDAM